MKDTSSYRTLRPEKIVETIERLVKRIEERFPASSLGGVARELHKISQEAVVRAERIRRPEWVLRVGIGVLVAGIIGLIVMIVLKLRMGDQLFEVEHFAALADSSLATFVVVGAAIAFLVTTELRIKRERAFKAVHELRALAHIVDMHQLTKDPERVTGRGPPTDSSPKRTMTSFELGRYLDYCSELLSLISKVGSLYVQSFPDRFALAAVDGLSTLTNGLARNIWQKIIILENMLGPADSAPAAALVGQKPVEHSTAKVVDPRKPA